jgi:LmbE family N-acetylglucosaminyl deacetylase
VDYKKNGCHEISLLAKPLDITCLVILFCLSLWLKACGYNENKTTINQEEDRLCVVLAHPDDETIISGTLAILSEQGFDISVVYVTSGDDGPDETGRGLHGRTLAEVRETEAMDALRVLEIERPPTFLRYPDGHVHENMESVQYTLKALMDEFRPQIVIGFGPDGITGHWDHKSAGLATDLAFDQTDYGKLLLHMAITKPLPPYYANGVAVPREKVDVCVKVSKYFNQRSQVVEAHKTQFNKRTQSAYKLFVHTMRKERFIIARNRDAEIWLESYFQN